MLKLEWNLKDLFESNEEFYKEIEKIRLLLDNITKFEKVKITNNDILLAILNKKWYIKELTNKLSIPNILRILLTFILVSFAWIFFRAENFESAIFVINRILTNHGSIFIDPSTFLLIAISFVIVFIYDFIKEYNVKISLTRYKVARYTLVIILLCYILALLSGKSSGRLL